MRSLLGVAALLLALGQTTVLAAANVEPRSVVSGVAKAIEDNYFDAERGKRIATDLRKQGDAGRFDALTDPRDLATALTGVLSPLDSHFSVRWSSSSDALPPTHATMLRRRAPPSGPPAQAPTGDSPRLVRRTHPGHDSAAMRINFGIRSVEVWPGNVGYIDLRQFANFEFGRPDAPARRAIEAALQLVSNTDALIIDLRHNGGGSPAMVGYLTSAFTPKGADIYNTFHSRHRKDSEAPRDWYPNPRLDVPLYLLTSARTGSAAEAFAYTLKNAKRATIVGDATGGAANPGGMIDAGQGFSVFVSDGTPVSPITGRNWEGTGVAPDIATKPELAQDKALELALASILERATPGTETTDTRWALEAVRARANTPERAGLSRYAGNYDAIDIAESNGRLFLLRGRRPPLLLQPLGNGVFSLDIDSNQRVSFESDARGRILALDVLAADGNASRYLRGPSTQAESRSQ